MLGKEDEGIKYSLESLHMKLEQINDKLDSIVSLIRDYVLIQKPKAQEQYEDNLKRLNFLVNEVKSVVAQARPKVKDTGWYGDEVKVKPVVETLPQVEYREQIKELVKTLPDNPRSLQTMVELEGKQQYTASNGITFKEQ